MTKRGSDAREAMAPRTLPRRAFVGLGLTIAPALAGCIASGRPCGSAEYSIRGIKNRELVGDTVEVRGLVGGTYQETSSGATWFILDDGSGSALVIPNEQRKEAVLQLAEDECLTVAGRVAEIYQGEFTSCVDPADGTCSFLTQDLKMVDATWS